MGEHSRCSIPALTLDVIPYTLFTSAILTDAVVLHWDLMNEPSPFHMYVDHVGVLFCQIFGSFFYRVVSNFLICPSSFIFKYESFVRYAFCKYHLLLSRLPFQLILFDDWKLLISTSFNLSYFPSLWVLSHFSHVWIFATLWTVAHQAPLSMGFSRQEYWSGLLCPPPRDLPNPGIKPGSPALQADSLPLAVFVSYLRHLYRF